MKKEACLRKWNISAFESNNAWLTKKYMKSQYIKEIIFSFLCKQFKTRNLL
jgi:hypothetical protein